MKILKTIKIMKVLGILLCLSIPAHASNLESQIKDPKLNRKQWKGISVANQWFNHKSMPTFGENGKVLFEYGATMPFIARYRQHIAKQPGTLASGRAGCQKIAGKSVGERRLSYSARAVD